MSDSESPIRVAVLMGGPSSEHEISTRSGQQVVSGLDESFEVIAVVIGKDGLWKIADDQPRKLGEALDELKERADVAFIALHGPFGEDGTVQGALDSAGIPYTGSGVLGSALAMDKVRAKKIYEANDLPISPSVTITPRTWSDHKSVLLSQISEAIGYPCVLKPAASGSSYGVSFPDSEETLVTEISGLLHSDVPLMLVEKRVIGAEFSCGVLDIDGRTQALPVIEIIPDPEKYEYFDLQAKYTPGATQEITPARIDAELTEALQELAVKAHSALGCRDFSRTDFLVSEDRQPILLETNTIPGLTAESLLPKSAKAAGYSFSELVGLLVRNAIQRGVTKYY